MLKQRNAVILETPLPRNMEPSAPQESKVKKTLGHFQGQAAPVTGALMRTRPLVRPADKASTAGEI